MKFVTSNGERVKVLRIHEDGSRTMINKTIAAALRTANPDYKGVPSLCYNSHLRSEVYAPEVLRLYNVGEMLKEFDVQIMYVGTTTIVFRRVGKNIHVSSAMMNPNDYYNRRLGANIALARYASGQFIQMPNKSTSELQRMFTGYHVMDVLNQLRMGLLT